MDRGRRPTAPGPRLSAQLLLQPPGPGRRQRDGARRRRAASGSTTEASRSCSRAVLPSSAYTASRRRSCRNPNLPERRASNPSAVAASSAAASSLDVQARQLGRAQRSPGGGDQAHQTRRCGGEPPQRGTYGDPQVGRWTLRRPQPARGWLSTARRGLPSAEAITRSSAWSSSRWTAEASVASARSSIGPSATWVTGTPRPVRSASMPVELGTGCAVAAGEDQQQGAASRAGDRRGRSAAGWRGRLVGRRRERAASVGPRRTTPRAAAPTRRHAAAPARVPSPWAAPRGVRDGRRCRRRGGSAPGARWPGGGTGGAVATNPRLSSSQAANGVWPADVHADGHGRATPGGLHPVPRARRSGWTCRSRLPGDHHHLPGAPWGRAPGRRQARHLLGPAEQPWSRLGRSS